MLISILEGADNATKYPRGVDNAKYPKSVDNANRYPKKC